MLTQIWKRLASPLAGAPSDDHESSSIPLLSLGDLIRRPRSRTTRSIVLALAPPTTLVLLLFVAVYSSLLPSSSDSLQHALAWKYLNGSNVDVFERLEIRAGDGSAKAGFIALGATMTDFWVKDRNGTLRDVVVGYSNTTDYLTDSNYAYFGAIVGRYANRIQNASFSLPSTSLFPQQKTYSLPINEIPHTTLHGGRAGYSRSGWKLEEHSGNKVVFSLRDEGAEDFPGTVLTTASYTLLSSPTRLVSNFSSHILSASTQTPLMLSSHIYWNLDGYKTEEGGRNMELWVDADRTIEVDGGLIPTGALPAISPSAALNFRNGSALDWKLSLREVEGLCGDGCIGIDNALIYTNSVRDEATDIVMSLSSPSSGIRFAVRTNQPAVHLYSCNSPLFAEGAYARKASQGGGTYGQYSCLAVEQEGMVDGIHHADEWDVNQIYDEHRPYEWWSEYEFSTFE
ncbi:hypothetical protein JCM1841_004315 [Sporobolomyces salmonicolor]